MKALFIYPNQLFSLDNLKDKLENYKLICLIEDSLYFKDEERVVNFNKLKLLLHRVSMKIYYDKLVKLFKNTKYIEFSDKLYQNINFIDLLKDNNIDELDVYDFCDHLLEKRLKEFCNRNKIKLNESLDTPYFIFNKADIAEYYEQVKDNKHILQNGFYSFGRKKFNILMNKGKFLGGKISYDKENRLPYNPNVDVPKTYNKTKSNQKSQNKYIKEGIKYIESNFKNNVGNINNYEYLSFSHEEANDALEDFIKHRLFHFGDYQDAFSVKEPYLFHSNLSHMMNIGLLEPLKVVKKIEELYNSHKSIGLNNIEGFIRQVLGWREYSRFLYVYFYDKMKNGNFMDSHNKLTPEWYSGTTGWTPVDITIKHAFDYGYLHHIQRLMIMGNIMNLMKFHPHEVYRWFMEFAVDSYDWVMVNNVYCMILYADGGFTTSKPYISSDNYLVKMSNGQFKPDGKWDKDMKTLFYNYIGDAPTIKNENFFATNGRTITMYKLWEKKVKSGEDKVIKNNAKEIIKRLSM